MNYLYRELGFPSGDGKNTVRAKIYEPSSGKARGIFQICHGMIDCVCRYEELADYLTGIGFIVCGADHLGHGDTVKDPSDFGYFAKKDGCKIVVDDVYRLNRIMKDEYKDLPTLAFTHFQPAQPTTVGKRASLWINEFMMDLEDLDYVSGSLKMLGSKGTTGTQASFLELFNGDHAACEKADQMIAEKMGFAGCYPVSGQTYSRKVDTRVINVLAGIAASATKFSNDIRLLQHLKEVEEPFEKSQIGSSAMAYKRNPMRSERIASLSRYVIADAMNPAITSSVQWFERTLDDSANKRLSVPEGFLACDGILDLVVNVVDGLVVYPKVITKHLMAELPFMATENIMMDAVKAGGDRQEMHEKIRQLSMEAGRNVKVEGLDNNLFDLIDADPAFPLTKEELTASLDPKKYVGRAPQQVTSYLTNVVNPMLEANKEVLGYTSEINV